ncbi:diguanylate cyclase [Aquabacterium sp.]|uniref:diguanylate cyclase n=1 Tax=Aquabacterium sp. TaxID=1872578 RepID=UPI0035C765A2
MNHRNRAGSWAMAFVVLATHAWEHGHGWLTWGLLGLQLLVYPHVVYWRARRASRQMEAEIQNLLLDNFCFGLWMAALGFPLWIAFMLFICGGMNMAAFRAGKGLLQGVGAALLGCALVWAVRGGVLFLPDTSLPVSLMSMAALAIYLVMFAKGAHTRTVVLHETRLKLRQSEAALQQQLQDIQALQAQLTDQANRDALTGLYNRHYLGDSMQREFDRCARDGEPLSILLIDLDHFKQINDAHGHAVGDEVLRQVAELLQQDTRSSDICCRYGGEEFLLVLPAMSLEAALARAEHCRVRVAERSRLAEGCQVAVTLSVGVASTVGAGLSPEALIALADQALYRAKAEGRNRVCLPQGEAPGAAADQGVGRPGPWASWARADR